MANKVQHKSKQTQVNTDKAILLIRFGGRGDALFLTPVITELKKEGYKVDVAINDSGYDLLLNNPNIRKLIKLVRVNPYTNAPTGEPINYFLEEGMYYPIEAIFKNYPTDSMNRAYNVIDYFRIIEQNTLHPILSQSQSSNFINAYDLHLSWAGLTPHKCSHRPEYYPKNKEIEEAERIIGSYNKPVVMLQTAASSPARSYHNTDLRNTLMSKNVGLLEWMPQGNYWILDGVKIESEIKGLRFTGALLAVMAKIPGSFVVSADTCVSHFAEALGVKHITFYSTVPAWSRSMGYEHEVTIDSNYKYNGKVCKCCVISRDCPLVQKQAWNKLPLHKQQLLGMIPAGHPVRQQMGLGDYSYTHPNPLAYFNLASPQALDAAIQGAVKDLEINLQEKAPCIKTIEEVLVKVVLKELGE